MRAFLSTTILALFLFSASHAQLLVGPTAGVNYSWLKFGDKDLKDLYGVTPVVGYHIGAHASFKVQKRFFLHTSLIYSTKGMVMKGIADEYDTEEALDEISMRLSFIEMPIVYTVYFKGYMGGKMFKYSLGVGPNLSYWVGGKGVLENQDLREFGDGPMDYKIVFDKNPFPGKVGEMVVENPNRIQLGLNLATSFLFEPAPQRELILTVRYEFGHSYLSRDSKGLFRPNTYYEQPLAMKNQGFRISLAYMFDLQIEKRKKGKSTNDPKKRRY